MIPILLSLSGLKALAECESATSVQLECSAMVAQMANHGTAGMSEMLANPHELCEGLAEIMKIDPLVERVTEMCDDRSIELATKFLDQSKSLQEKYASECR